MIIEGIVTTLNPDQTVNISPMGPIIELPMTKLRLRPYQSSTTFQNLQRSGSGVFHITDDVLLFAQAAIGTPSPPPQLLKIDPVSTPIIKDACRWYAFEIEELDTSQDRTNIIVNITHQGRLRDFLGFNRAKHAVIEAAILATRVNYLPMAEILAEMKRLAIIVQKTAGSQETEAFEFLRNYIDQQIQNKK